MSFITTLIERAKADKKTIILPEGHDMRVLEAAEEVLKQEIANLIIVGNEEEINASGFDLTGAQIINPATYDKTDEFINTLYELRKAKGLTLEEATDLIKNDVNYFATMMIKAGLCDGMVSGASCATVKVLSPALRVLKTAPGAPMVSSLFIMDVPNCELGEDGVFVFADCALEVQPTAEKLAHIANMTGDSFKRLLNKEPRIALLSHSTMGSAKNDDAKKVQDAMAYIRENYPDLNADGELQLD
ncbi:MAG: phosphate acyltransferase, partial [Anaerotardibacter sp.]